MWTETYANKNAGAGKTLTPAGVVSDGNSGLNYSYTYAPVTTGVIAQTNLTVTAATNTKNYDGNNSAAATPTITAGNIQPGDTAPAWTETYDTPDAGTGKTLSPAHLVVTDSNGGNNYNYNYVPDLTGVINALTTTTLLSADVNPSVLGSNVTFTATVSAAVSYPTGNVVFSANGTAFATNGLSSASASASTTALPVGTNTITAQYLGALDYQGSTSASLAQVVTNSVIYSQTNSITSIVNNHNGTFTLHFTGTAGAQYYVVASSSLKTHMASWTPVEGTTNITASSPSGAWSCVVSNPTPAYYRPVAVNPAP